MKFVLALLSLLASASAAVRSAPLDNIKVDSEFGMSIMRHARQLNNNNDDGDVDFTWVTGYSIKFLGCYQVSQWNDQADNKNDVRIATKKLVRFRLCPSDSCASSCNSGYGDYVIDMGTYLASYIEAKQKYQEFQCKYLEQNVCYCDNDNNNNENYSKEMCMWDCYAEHNMETICMDNNPYENQDDQGNADNKEMNLQKYMECAQYKVQNNNNNGNNNGNNNNNAYYVGPYCAENGGIYMGFFTDDSCSTYADDKGGSSTFTELTGMNLPYGQTNIVDSSECFSCIEPKEKNNDGNDADDGDEVAQVCETLYAYAGKCESNLPSGTVSSPDTQACTYIQGIKIVQTGSSSKGAKANKANKTASVFIGIFVVAFVLLSAYVYYLKTKLDRASINLAE